MSIKNCVFILFFLPLTTVIAEPLIHVLAKGETLYFLAGRYNVKLSELLEKNGIENPENLSVGTRLFIPNQQNPTENMQYSVKPGDTYFSIAKRHNLTMDSLLAVNNRESNLVLKVGEVLVIPTSFDSHASNEQISRVPRWPVAGYMRPLDGKLEGVSIMAEPASYVHAVAAGSAIWTGPYRGFGQVVLIEAGDYIYLYGGNKDLFVNVGQIVETGSRIGRLGGSDPRGGTQEMIFAVFKEGVPFAPEKAPRN